MNFRLRTSKYVEKKLKLLQSSTNLTPNILARISIALSLQKPEIPSTEITDTTGLEFNRNTLTGEYDYVYRALITEHAQKEISDEEFFPGLFNAHLERGIRLLESEYRHAGNSEKFMLNLLQL